MGSPGERGSRPRLPVLAPMLAVTAPTLPDHQERHGFEAKLDGFRALVYLDSGEIQIRSRTGTPMHSWLPEFTVLADLLPDRRVILDGEVVAVIGGRPSIDALQQRQRTRRPSAASAPVLLAVFDLLFLDGELLTGRPYRERRALLEELHLAGDVVQTVPAIFGDGEAMWAAVVQQDLEGVLAKRLDSVYEPGRRSRAWLKVLHYRRLRLRVGGFVPAGSQLAALLVGEPDPTMQGRLRFVGRVDHGLSVRVRQELAAVLAEVEIPGSPFTGTVASGGWGRAPGQPPRWVRPLLEVEVEHLGRDPQSGWLRHPRLVTLLGVADP